MFFILSLNIVVSLFFNRLFANTLIDLCKNSILSRSPYCKYVGNGANGNAVKEDIFLGVPYEAGYIPVGIKGGVIFYWLIPKEKSLNQKQNEYGETVEEDDDTYIIWLNGGPGCSSSFAAFMENGPVTLHTDGRRELNPYSWHKITNILYVDQPVGTGFSVVGPAQNTILNENEVADYMKQFILGFVYKYPEYKKKSLYIFGESFAGHYIPAIARKLMEDEFPKILGIAIGNGWVDPAYLFESYAEFAKINNLISPLEYMLYSKAFKECAKLIRENKDYYYSTETACSILRSYMIGNKNPYDIRKTCNTLPLCYDTQALTAYLNSPEVQETLQVHVQWTNCNPIVYFHLAKDMFLDWCQVIAELLNKNVPTLIYNGDKDFLCNWLGTELWMDQMKWNGSAEFNEKENIGWTINGSEVGLYREGGPLTYMRIFNAGHMVPMDQPLVAFKMIQRFIKKTSMKDFTVVSQYNDCPNCFPMMQVVA